tara:strand:+ start:742 stop:1689 length:948 start_codon:yes stop_codon:yes gene_type:complete
MRDKILEINKDNSLTKEEKTVAIQKIFQEQYTLKHNLNESCEHYDKKCSKFSFNCCNVKDPCKRCHVARDTCSDVKITEIECNICSNRQKPSQYCENCKVKFCETYCDICQIWTNKEIFHCNDCGICRVGKRNETFHCFHCGMCFLKNVEHICLKNRVIDQTCVVCHNKIFDNNQSIFPLRCGHFMDVVCFNQYVSHNNYKCPLCKKSMWDMSKCFKAMKEQILKEPIAKNFFPLKINDIVPTDFGKFKIENIYNDRFYGSFIDYQYHKGELNKNSILGSIYFEIFCNDCEKKSLSLYHYIGYECNYCNGFNTQK